LSPDREGLALAARPGLELRTRALYDIDFANWRKSAGTSQLLARAEERIASLPVPDGELVFVHGDLWQGNTILSGDSCSGMIDWDAAGAGSPGIDLDTLALRRGTVFRIIGQLKAAGGRLSPDEVATLKAVAAREGLTLPGALRPGFLLAARQMSALG
jgi:aminoglycoside phosphotransferase (APT) family kinase protein